MQTLGHGIDYPRLPPSAHDRRIVQKDFGHLAGVPLDRALKVLDARSAADRAMAQADHAMPPTPSKA
jgi:hypothetical protein